MITGLPLFPPYELIRIERVRSLALSRRTHHRCKPPRLTRSGHYESPHWDQVSGLDVALFPVRYRRITIHCRHTDGQTDVGLTLCEQPSSWRRPRYNPVSLIWHRSDDNILIVDCGPVQVLLSAVSASFPPKAFLPASQPIETIRSKKVRYWSAALGATRSSVSYAPCSPWRSNASSTL